MQCLRALAALLVVLEHATLPTQGFSTTAHFEAGAAGVDIFFVLSGYIIYLTQARVRGVALFIYRRFVRIIPLYWAVTAVFIFLHLVFGEEPGARLPIGHVVESFLLIPHRTPGLPTEIYPVLVPGWTLCYEMFFYGLFAVGLLVAPGRLALFLSVVICSLAALGRLLNPQQAILATYTSSLSLEFVAGVMIAVMTGSRPPPRLAGLLVPLGLVLMFLALPGPRFLAWGAPAAMAVYGALALEPYVRARWPVLLGDASYSLYLTQFAFLPVLRGAWLASGLPKDALLFAVLGVPACALFGVAVHLAVERRLLGWLKRPVSRAADHPARAIAPSQAKGEG